MDVFFMFSSSHYRKERVYFFIGLALLLLYVSPLYILGEDAHIRVHDNLDSNIAWYKVLAESGQLKGPLHAVIPQVMNGIDRGSFGTEWSLIVWLHYLFPSMTAYALSQTITRVVAFIGMYLLLRKHFITEEKASFITIGVSLAFALTPFWPSGMLSTLGHPLALWAFLNIRNRDSSWKEWLTLALIPFYSSIVLGFFFLLVAVFLLWLYDGIFKKRWNVMFLLSIAFMTLIYLLIEYRLIYSLLIPHEISHRSEFISSRHVFAQSFRLSFKNFIFGHTHVHTMHTAIILPILFLASFLVIVCNKLKQNATFLFLFFLSYVLSLWYALWFNKMWIPLKSHIDLLNTFNFARFHFLRPLVIYVSFALACYILYRMNSFFKALSLLAVAAQIIVLAPFNEEFLYGSYYHPPSFREFYAEKQFQDIKEHINLPQSAYRVASIGIHPAIAQYNGFYTLDSYSNVYPLSYKYQFRKIIASELDKDDKIRTYFDEWGSRCYIFVAELGKKYEFRKDSKKKIKNLELNTGAFKEMGGKYLFSALPILNANDNNLELVKVFDHKESAWKIYLYEAK
ncbi:DUF6044 family protein [Priestia endophytica]|nr:hypothetical protein AZF06_23520 [Priestia endophytica]